MPIAREGEREAPKPHERGQIGPYELLEPIARGAMGVVYRARRAETGEEVALKTLQTAEPFTLASLRREAYALQRIQHRDVVRMLDYGVENNLPWYAMELIEGGTLADSWRGNAADSERAPPAQPRSLPLLQQLCAPLAFLHGEGIVHRDLKPANIAIRADGHPVIVDFGLMGQWSASLAREALHAGGELIGTADYMAPEQARGEYVDARADLYSLGCILYESVTGRPPFEGDPATVVMAHLDDAPVPPSEIVPEVDPRLQALILQLLEKQPRHRLGFADDVARALAEITQVPLEPGGQDARPYLYRPAFVGREGLRHSVGQALDRAERGHGACLLLSGESGSGKTRFAMEMTRSAAARGFQVITGECIPVEGTDALPHVRAAPLTPLKPLLRAAADRCIAEGPATTERILGRRAKILASYEPALRSVPGFGSQPEPASLMAAAERSRVLGCIAELVALTSEDRPLLWVLDDLQWADDMTLALLESMGEGFFERAGVVILGSFRREEMGPELARVLEAPHVERIELGRLDRDEVRAMTANMLAIDPPPRPLVRLLNRASEGNPFFVAEFLRAAVEAQMLGRSPAGTWQATATHRTEDPLYGSLPLPRSLRDLVTGRLDEIDEPAASLLAAGAILGREFDAGLADEVLEASEGDSIEARRLLLQRQILEEVGGRRLRFAHDKLREVAYTRIPEPRAIALHRRAAGCIEARHGASDDFPTRYAELAHHWEMAGAKDHAVEYLGAAGEHALATGAHNDAHLLIVRALALDDEMRGRSGPFQRAKWRRMLGVAAFGTGDLEASIGHSSEALTGLGEGVPNSTAGWVWVASKELARSLRPGSRRARPGEEERMFEIARACGQLATSYFYNAEVVPAAATLLRGLNRAESAGDEATVVQSCARLGYVSGAIGQDGLARRLFTRAHATAEHADDPGGQALAYYLDAMYQQFLGRWDNCRALAESASEILEEIGDQPEAETALAIASHGHFFAGHFRGARQRASSILQSADERAHEHHIGWGQYLIARCDVVEGRLEDAVGRLNEARRLLEAIPDQIDIVITEGWLARAMLYLGRDDDASELAASLERRLWKGRRPAVGQCVDGYGGWADAALSIWQRDPDSKAAARASERACSELRGFARVFRMASPAAHRCTARADWIRGRRGRALRRWNRSIEKARKLAMPWDEACALAELGLATAGTRAGDEALEQSGLRFGELGCFVPPGLAGAS